MGRTRDVSLREGYVMTARARTILDRLIQFFAIYGPPDKHFKGSHAAESGRKTRAGLMTLAEKQAKGIQTLFEAFGVKNRTIEDSTETAWVVAAGYRIMERLARGESVETSDLDIITEVLNAQTWPIRFHGGSLKRLHPLMETDPYEPYRRETESAKDRFVQDLLAYMNHCARHGPEHGICRLGSCGALMVAGRGAKKFCSVECRKAFWSYDRQKAYFQMKRSKSRQNDRRNRNLGRATKGAKK